MGVKLKQRTYRTADGRAVGEGNPDAAILIGPAGSKVSDEQAKSLGLVNGALPASSEDAGGEKAAEGEGDKAFHGKTEDKEPAHGKKRSSKKRS